MADTSQAIRRPELPLATRTPRPILHLQNPPPPKPAEVIERWKGKPCGATLEIDAALEPQAVVRCPACKACLGRAGQFRDGGDGAVRARRA